ncbi:hypothetical protein C7434_0794 [Pantoea sp. PNA 14-12]|nr:hypothetical protein C7434_0794 [Pantoea sp. PNA 14-12]
MNSELNVRSPRRKHAEASLLLQDAPAKDSYCGFPANRFKAPLKIAA